MKLNNWIDAKLSEMVTEQKYRKAEFVRATPAKISRYGTQEILHIGGPQEYIPMDAEVEVVDRSTLPDGFGDGSYIDAAKVTFEVLAPRKRKMSRQYFYLKLLEGAE